MAMMKLCSHTGCNKVIDCNAKYCDRHKELHEREERKRHRLYKQTRYTTKAKKRDRSFYDSKKWKRARDQAILNCMGMDVYLYMTTGIIRSGERVHHILTLEDSWDDRLYLGNLIYLTEQSHREIHAAYAISKESKEKLQEKLFLFLKKLKKVFK